MASRIASTISLPKSFSSSLPPFFAASLPSSTSVSRLLEKQFFHGGRFVVGHLRVEKEG